MRDPTPRLAPHEFWQKVHPAGTFDLAPPHGFHDLYPATFADGRQIALPIRVLPEGDAAVASLIVNQASFAVVDALGDALADLAKPHEPEVIVGVPTLGLPLAEGVARRLGHERMVALGTSRKFWYDEALSRPLVSITSPGQGKRLYLDPRMLPLVAGRRVAVVDDVISTGASIDAVLGLLALGGVTPVVVLAGMLQGERWRTTLSFAGHLDRVAGALATPRFRRREDDGGGWEPAV